MKEAIGLAIVLITLCTIANGGCRITVDGKPYAIEFKEQHK